MLTYGDTISWNKGKHAFKGGVEFRRDRSDGWNDNNFTPFATIGAGNFTAPIDNTVTGLSGLTSNNGTTARNILYNLSGSIDNIKEGFDLRSSQKPVFLGYADGVKMKERDWHDNEVTAFFKDAWKVTSNLTLNLGVKWEWYGVPYEARGLAGRVVNGIQGLCGIACGALTTVELVGKNSPQPEKSSTTMTGTILVQVSVSAMPCMDWGAAPSSGPAMASILPDGNSMACSKAADSIQAEARYLAFRASAAETV